MNTTSDIERNLRTSQKDVSNTLNKLSKEDPFFDPVHTNDNAASDTDAFEQSSHQRIESIQNELRKRLLQIQNALQKLRKGKYGVCESCGKKISKERLSIVPAATFCIECERKKER